MIYYIINTIIFQLIFLVIYDLLNKKDTFFALNRSYLLATSILSLILPFIKIDSIKEFVPEQYLINLPTVFIGNQSQSDLIVDTISSSSFLWNFDLNWWLVAYCIITVIMLSLFIKKIYNIRSLKAISTIDIIGTYKIYTLPDNKEAFSFWDTIYLGNQLSDQEKKQIITHELVHLEEKHSLDLIWFELLKTIFWFNPLIYVYQSRTNSLHEFIADAKSITTLGKRNYYEQLLNTVFQTKEIKFINQFFNHSLIKKRIVMLQKSKSKSIAKFKYLFIIPVIGSMLLYSSCSDETKTTEEIINNKNNLYETEEVPFMKLDKPPVLESCKDIAELEEQKKCMSEEIKKYVNQNFDIEAMEPFALNGINRIYTRFKIDKTGKVIDVQVRASVPELEKEAKRVVESLPKMIPGEYQGKKVGVLYSLPIIFKLNVDETTDTSKKDVNNIAVLEMKNSDIENGYYIIANIFKKQEYLTKGLTILNQKQLNPKVFKNKEDGYFYVYLGRHDTEKEAKEAISMIKKNNYNKDLYIMKIEN